MLITLLANNFCCKFDADGRVSPLALFPAVDNSEPIDLEHNNVDVLLDSAIPFEQGRDVESKLIEKLLDGK